MKAPIPILFALLATCHIEDASTVVSAFSRTIIVTRFERYPKYEALKLSEKNAVNVNGPAIIFPGGGLFFYWQAGVIVRAYYDSVL